MERLATWLTANLRWLKSQLRRRGRAPEEAEDLIQEAYLRVVEYCERGQVREPERVLVRAVSNLLLNQERDQRRRPIVGQAIEELSLVDPAPLPEERVMANQRLKHVIRALESVEDRAREAFLLHRVDGLSYPQIARQLGVSVSTVEKRIAWVMAVLMDASRREGKRP
jgi:RNA polymerase sigma factor (sigma-70 family)